MRREELELDDGLLCLSINGKSETIFNPTDAGFIEKLFHVFETLDAKQNALETRIKAAQQNEQHRELFKIVREADAEMRKLVDDVMGAGTCDAQFGAVNVYAYAGGLPLWANLLLAVLDRCEAEMVQQQKAMHARLTKYTEKYQKKA